MKPQLVEAGFHNADLPKSTARIIQGASWKKTRTIMLIPAGESIPTKVYLTHCSLIFPPNQPAHRMAAIGYEVGEAYSNAIEQILAHPELSKWEFLLSVEHDNMVPSDGLIKLIASMERYPQYAAISALYWTKGENGVPQCWGDASDPLPNYRPQAPRVGEVMEVNGIGMGMALWRLKMFKDDRLRRPWFRTIAGREGVGTQDLTFAADAKKYGYRFAVDCNVLSGHYDLEGKFGPADTIW